MTTYVAVLKQNGLELARSNETQVVEGNHYVSDVPITLYMSSDTETLQSSLRRPSRMSSPILRLREHASCIV